jgi:hypothetical protein
VHGDVGRVGCTSHCSEVCPCGTPVTAYGEAYDIWPLTAKAPQLWLRRYVYEHTSRALSSTTLRELMATLEAQALFAGPQAQVACRLAGEGETVWLDLGNAAREVVRLTPAGWEITTTAAVKFLRPRGMAALPRPVPGGTLEDLHPFLNMATHADWLLCVAWLLSAFRPAGPYPVLILHGEQGTAKSTTARVLRALLDPNVAPLRTEPRDERDLMIAAINTWFIMYDNVSQLRPWLSDALCRLATGGEEGGKLVLSAKGAERIAHPQVDIGARESRMSDTSRLLRDGGNGVRV